MNATLTSVSYLANPQGSGPAQSGLTFTPVTREEIDAKHFVDLTSVDDNRGLKMMASLKGGKLVLVSGKNKGLLREIWHHRSSSKPNYYQAEVDTPDTQFTRLWIGRDLKLHARYKDTKTGNEHHCILKLNGQFTENMSADFNVRVDKTPVQGGDNVCVDEASDEAASTITLKDQIPAKVFLLDSRHLVIGEEKKVRLNLRLSSDDVIESIKPCGPYLQVAIERTNKTQRIVYLDAQHLSVSEATDCVSPRVSEIPPASFAHYNINNSGHFSNANPFVGYKAKHIGHQYVPLSGWIDGIKHRLSRGNEKWSKGRKAAAMKSYAKAADPGLQTTAHWIKDKIAHRKPSPVITSVAQRIGDELRLQEQLKSKWEQGGVLRQWVNNPARVHAKVDQEMRVAMAVYAGSSPRSESSPEPVEQGLKKQLASCTVILNHLVPGFTRGDGPYDERLKKQLDSLQQRMDDLTEHPLFDKLNEFSDLAVIKSSLRTLASASATPFTFKDLDLYVPYIERTLTNARLYLAICDEGQFKFGQTLSNDTLAKKVSTENHADLQQAITQGLASRKALRQAQKPGVRLGESLRNRHNGLGNVVNKWMGRHHPAQQINAQITQRVSALPQGDSLTLSAHDGVSGFAGIAHFGLPFAGGYFAGIVANYEKHYDCKLVSLGDNKTQVQLVRKGEKGASALVGTGGGLEDLTKLVKYRHGSLVTIMPFEATLALTAMQDSEQSFAFDVSNDDLQKTLGYLFRTEDWPSELEAKLDKTQFSSRETKKTQLSGSANSQLRLQLGIDASPNFSMVMPRTYAKAGVEIAVTREETREFNVGEQTSATQRLDYITSVDLEASSGASVMLFPLSSTHAFPTAIDEKTFVSVKPFGDRLAASHTAKHHTTETVEKRIAESKSVSLDMDPEPLDRLDTVITDFRQCLESHPEWSLDMKSRASAQLMALVNARTNGFHEVTKAIAAENIPHLKVEYQQQIHWRSRWADNMRRTVHLTPKHSQSLGQLMQGNPSARKMLKALRASSQSQSQRLNMNKASAVMAEAKYQLPMERLIDVSTTVVNQLKEAENHKQASALLNRLNEQLSRKGDTARSQYRLMKIECTRVSSLCRHPAGILPMLQVKKLSQVTLNESLGEISFRYPDGEKPEMVNRLDGTLYSVPR
ncbi:hypothetical protein ACODM8_16850 [Vibrio ostreicida]|uniref:hypothetical protein n=1 Tax=Vibrio ostreicida TaxID=526588 RepID=UPI003B5A5AC9